MRPPPVEPTGPWHQLWHLGKIAFDKNVLAHGPQGQDLRRAR